MACHEDQVETMAVLGEPGHRIGQVRQPQYLHAHLLQGWRVGFDKGAVVGEEGHRAAVFQQKPEDVAQAHRAGVVIRLRRGGIDDEHVLFRSMLARDDDVRAGSRVRGQCLFPARQEFFLIDHLIALGAGGGVGARTDAFEMHDHRRGLVQHAQAGGTHLHRKVGVLVIGRCVMRVETAELAEQLCAQRDGSTGAVIHFAYEVVLGFCRIIEAAVVPARAIGEHDAAGLLQAAIGIHQLGAGQPHVLMLRKSIDQRVKPAILDGGVVVEEHDEFATCVGGAGIAGADETGVLRVALVTQAAYLRQHAG